jgi:hypothetical protein
MLLCFGGVTAPRVSPCPRHSKYLFGRLHERNLLRVKVVGIQQLLRGLLLGQVVEVAVVLGEQRGEVRLRRRAERGKEGGGGCPEEGQIRSIDRA